MYHIVKHLIGSLYVGQQLVELGQWQLLDDCPHLASCAAERELELDVSHAHLRGRERGQSSPSSSVAAGSDRSDKSSNNININIIIKHQTSFAPLCRLRTQP